MSFASRTAAIAVAGLLMAAAPAHAAGVVAAYWQGSPAAASLPASMLTHIVYAFASPSGGQCNTPNSTAQSRINALAAVKAAHPGMKVLISIGGWGAAGFSADSASAASRQAFVSSCITRWVNVFGAGLVDGFDIDWEFPVYGGLPSIGASPDDRANLNLLVQEFRTQLRANATARGVDPDGVQITAAIPAGRIQDAGTGVSGAPYDQAKSFDLAALGQLLDYVNLMTYDLCTGYSLVSCFNDPMVQRAGDPNDQYNNNVGGVQYMEDHGVPANKIVLGVPFYGRYFNVTSSANGGLYQPWTASTTVNYSTLVGSQYIANTAYLKGWDPVVQSPFLWNPTTRRWVSYEDPQSITIRSSFAKNSGLAGMMMWQLGGDDSTGSLLRAMARPWLAITPPAGTAPAVTGAQLNPAVGQPYSGPVATIEDPDTPVANLTALINWGDDTPASNGTVSGADGHYTVTGTHTYAQVGNYMLTVRAGDGDPVNVVSANATAATSVQTPVDGGVGASVPATLALTLGTPGAFGAFTPGVAKDYTATTSANVISTAGDAALTFSDPGHLANGAFTLPEPLQIELSKSAWSAPASNDPVTITFRQHIGAGDALRTGAYSRTVTFTLSTTTP